MTSPLSNVELIPLWKRGASIAERFHELALLAEKHPESFNAMACVYFAVVGGKLITRVIQDEDSDTIKTLGLFQAGIQHLWEITRG